MKKNLKIFIIVLVMFFTIIGLNTKSVKSEMKEVYANNTIPTCSVVLPSKVRVAKEATGTIICRNADGFSDVSISKDDLKVESSCLSKVKITYVSSGASSNGTEYYWKFTMKGRIIGRFGIQLKPSSVSSIYGVGNWATYSYSKVTLF